MKKLMALLMASLMLLSLCACSSKAVEEEEPSEEEELYEKYEDLISAMEDEDYEAAIQYIAEQYEDAMGEEQEAVADESPFAPSEDAAVSGKDEALYQRYDMAMNGLANFISNGGSYLSIGYVNETGEWVSEDYEYHDAAAKLYELFESLGDYEMAPEILSRFSVVSDVLLKYHETEYNAFGEAQWENNYYYWHNEDGQLVSEGSYTRINKTYDAEGKLIEEKSVSSDTTNWVVTYTYDETGKLIQTEKLDSYGDKTLNVYNYDENGILLTREETYNEWEPEIFEYVYDEIGNLIMENQVSDWSHEAIAYAYDNEGRVIEMTEGWMEKNDAGEFAFDDSAEHHTYTYEDGHLVFEVVTDDNGKDEYTYFYGDLYTLDFEGLVLPEPYNWY